MRNYRHGDTESLFAKEEADIEGLVDSMEGRWRSPVVASIFLVEGKVITWKGKHVVFTMRDMFYRPTVIVLGYLKVVLTKGRKWADQIVWMYLENA